MKKLIVRLVFVLLTVSFVSLNYNEAKAQCAMCSLTADASVKNGNKQGEKLNKGILVLLSAPYLAVGLIGLVWYKRYRRNQHSEE